MNILDLPFNQLVGFELTQHNGRDVVSLEPRKQHCNHLGTIHASALYALGEAASGHALLETLDLNPANVLAVLRSAKVKYRRPAQDRVVALANVDETEVVSFRQQFENRGRAFLIVQVRVFDGATEQEVFAGDFTWFVSQTDGTTSAETPV